MRTFNIRSEKKFVLLAIIMILFASTIWISSVSALPQEETSLGVKITNPAKGQEVAIGKSLTLSGTSSYNTTSNCGIFVIVDGVKPYQKTTPDKQEEMIILDGSTHLLQHMPVLLGKGLIE
ncbi:MAG TPA: hypothetical protein VEL11_19070 [Candidatus Bathyarchaeia archaeon]|nr:hypothetical protein [Candidatus Bathyarchaeia archaeon]